MTGNDQLDMTRNKMAAVQPEIKMVAGSGLFSPLWKQALDAQLDPPSPDGDGQKVTENGIELVWMTTEPAPKSVLKCVGCKTCKMYSIKACPCTDACGYSVKNL